MGAAHPRGAVAACPSSPTSTPTSRTRGLQTSLVIDRDAAARLGMTPRHDRRDAERRVRPAPGVDDLPPLNQYRVVMEAAPEYWQTPEALDTLRELARRRAGAAVGVRALRADQHAARASITRASSSPSTISFNLPEGVSLSQATRAIDDALARIGVPTTIRGSFQGTARAFQASLASQPMLILAALLTRLHRARRALRELRSPAHHPVDAALGGRRRAARAACCSRPSSAIIALIGVILLIGIVKKNAIMMIDFALDAERAHGMRAARRDLRGLPAALPADHDDDDGGAARRAAARARHGDGAELRQPLGIAIVGGLSSRSSSPSTRRRSSTSISTASACGRTARFRRRWRPRRRRGGRSHDHPSPLRSLSLHRPPRLHGRSRLCPADSARTFCLQGNRRLEGRAARRHVPRAKWWEAYSDPTLERPHQAGRRHQLQPRARTKRRVRQATAGTQAARAAL